MSNDKIYIKCKGCGKFTTFARYFPKRLESWGDGISQFIEEHQNCIEHCCVGDDLCGNRCFDLMPESDDRFELWTGDKDKDTLPFQNKFWRITQKEDKGFNPSFVHTMIVRAKTEKKARDFAQKNENEERDGLLKWDKGNATCDIVYRDNYEAIVLVA